jgi:streptogramin lyase
MAVTAGSLWVADCKERTLHRIDTSAARTTAVIATGIANPTGELNVVAGAGSIWAPSAPSGAIARVDPGTNTVVSTIRVNPGAYYLAFGFGSLWAVSSQTRTLQRIDPKTNAVVATIKLGRKPGLLVAGEDGVWVQEQGDGTVARIDPRTNALTGRVKISDTLIYGDIDTGGGAVWLRTTSGQTYVIIDPLSMKVLARVGKERGSGALRYTPSGLWVTAHDAHTLSWFNAASGGAP